MRISDWSSDVCSSDLRTVLEQVPSADSTDHESNGEVRRRDSVHQTIGKTGIENDVPPARPGQELTIGPHLEADRSVRSEERRVGKESVSTCRSRWSP